jgi:hypothetical protein
LRIIGGHDFYDGAQALGQDLERVFVRTPFGKTEGRPVGECGLEPLNASRLLLVPDQARHRYSSDDKVDNRKGRFDFRPLVVWFAGMRHACVKVEGRFNGEEGRIDWCAWSATELNDFLLSVESGLADTFWSGDDLSARTVDKWFASPGSDAEREWLTTEGVSIAISHGMGSVHGRRAWHDSRRWKIDTDGLKELGFARVLPPWEAFQKLEMWVGGILSRPGRSIVEIESDSVRRDKHGFDGMSFKKPKAQGQR